MEDVVITDSCRFEPGNGPKPTVSYFEDIGDMSGWFHVAGKPVAEEFGLEAQFNFGGWIWDGGERLELMILWKIDDH